MKDSTYEAYDNNEGFNQKTESTKEEADKKCPDCGGIMDFDPKTGGMLCPYCGHCEQVGKGLGEPTADELDFLKAEETGNFDWGAGKKTVICKFCGGEMVYDELELAGECPYCGSNQVMEEKGTDSLAPNGVCPFKIDNATAGKNFTKWIKGKLFCPSEAKKKAKADAFKGVYLPYWTFDTDTCSKYSARYGIDRTVRNSKGETRTVTDWHWTSGVYSQFFDDQLVAASTRQDAKTLSKIEPFSTADNVVYRPEYLAGFASERYSIGIKDAWSKAKEKIKQLLKRNISNHVETINNADHVDSLSFSTDFQSITYKYLLLPVWLSAFTYKGKTYRFAVNGQTGKVGGKTPISPLRVAIAVILCALVIGAIVLISQEAK